MYQLSIKIYLLKLLTLCAALHQMIHDLVLVRDPVVENTCICTIWYISIEKAKTIQYVPWQNLVTKLCTIAAALSGGFLVTMAAACVWVQVTRWVRSYKCLKFSMLGLKFTLTYCFHFDFESGIMCNRFCLSPTNTCIHFDYNNPFL